MATFSFKMLMLMSMVNIDRHILSKYGEVTKLLSLATLYVMIYCDNMCCKYRQGLSPSTVYAYADATNMWLGAPVSNCHLRGPVTLTPIAERLAVELSLPIFTTDVCRGGHLNSQPSACEAKRSNRLCHRGNLHLWAL